MCMHVHVELVQVISVSTQSVMYIYWCYVCIAVRVYSSLLIDIIMDDTHAYHFSGINHYDQACLVYMDTHTDMNSDT